MSAPADEAPPRDDPRGRRGLGRGLSALLGEPLAGLVSGAGEGGLRSLPIESLRPGRLQPRRTFSQTAIEELAQSMRERGVLQPILVRPEPEQAGRFEIIAGERRWRAAQAAGLHEIPAIVRALNDQEALEAALVENLQRQDLNPLEEAEGYRRLMEEFGHTQEELAGILGKSRSHLANMLRLLSLPEAVKALLEGGVLTAGHARALVGSADPEGLAARIAGEGLSVRQAEALARQAASPRKHGRAKAGHGTADADIAALERELGEALGLAVTLAVRGGGGTLTIRYRTLEQLDDLLRRLSRRPDGGAAPL